MSCGTAVSSSTHYVRHFPELPVALSSELGGCDIEYYYRQNAEIADYSDHQFGGSMLGGRAVENLATRLMIGWEG